MTCLLKILLRCIFDVYIDMYITHVYYVFHIMLWLLLFDL
jgi:hypothetical protein